eukprot:s520_g33.t1
MQYAWTTIKDKIYKIHRAVVKVEVKEEDDSGPKPMDVDETADLRRDLNRRKRQMDEMSQEVQEQKNATQENCASEYAGKIRGLQEELLHEQSKLYHFQDRLDLAERNRDIAIEDRNAWELKCEHFQKNCDEQLATIEDLEAKVKLHQDSVNNQNKAVEYYQSEMEAQSKSAKAEIEKYKILIQKQDAEIEQIKKERDSWEKRAQEAKQASRSNKTSGLFAPETTVPVLPGKGTSVTTSLEHLAAVIDKQSLELIELKRKLSAAEEHVMSLRREIQAVKTPDVVAATKSGQCFHKHDCNHLRCGREPRGFIDLKKCKDCFP